jgi:hypothetical protein
MVGSDHTIDAVYTNVGAITSTPASAALARERVADSTSATTSPVMSA